MNVDAAILEVVLFFFHFQFYFCSCRVSSCAVHVQNFI